MAVNITDKQLEKRIATIAAKQSPPSNKKALVVAMLDQACRRCETTKDPQAWKS